MPTGNGKPIVLVIIGGIGNNVLSSFSSAVAFSRAVYEAGVQMPLVPALQLPMWRSESKVTEEDLDGLYPLYVQLIGSGLVSAVKFSGKVQYDDRLRQICADKKVQILA